MSARDEAAAPAPAVVATRLGEGLAKVTLSRPERRNAVGPQTATDFHAAVAAMASWETRVVVLDAEGPAFCAGADLSDLEAASAAVDEVIALVADAPVCWVAAVRGAVRGAGLALIDACPVVFAAEDATFGLPELARGFFPGALVEGPLSGWPRRTAYGLAFSSLPVDARRAQALGIVNEVVTGDELEGRVLAEAERLAAAEPDAVREGVRLWQQRLR